jgi:hypothetical protein
MMNLIGISVTVASIVFGRNARKPLLKDVWQPISRACAIVQISHSSEKKNLKLRMSNKIAALPTLNLYFPTNGDAKKFLEIRDDTTQNQTKLCDRSLSLSAKLSTRFARCLR